MNLFDLSKFEKVAEDKHSTTMRHADGHEIKVVHSSLPKLKREQLKRLKLAKGGGVEHFVDGGDVSSNDTNGSEAPTGGAPAPTNITINATPAPQAAPIPVQAAAPAPIQNPAESLNKPVEPQNVPIPSNLTQSPIEPNGQLNPGKQAQMAQQGFELQKNIDIAKGKQLADVQAGMNAANVTQAQNLTNNLNTLANQTKAISDYTLSGKNQINPNQYLENRSVPQKIANAFGLLAGGLKQGLIGGDNPAMTFINSQIQRDIDAQKNRQDQVKTVYGYYKDLYGAGNVTNSLTQAAMNNIYDGKLKQIAYDMATPQAIQAYQAFAAQKGAENQKLLQDTATQLSALPGYNGSKIQGEVPPPSAPPSGAPSTSGGAPSSPFGAFSTKPEEKTESSDHILNPNHDAHFKSLMYTPKAKEMLPAIQAQYNQAVQAEKGLSDIHGTFQSLADAAEKTGEAGNIRRNFEHAASSVPYVGGALSALPRYVTDTQNNRAYDANKVSLLGYVSSALKGTNIGSGQIQEIVDTNAPEYGDTPELIAKKEKNIRDFIKNHTDTSLLDTWGLTPKKGK